MTTTLTRGAEIRQYSAGMHTSDAAARWRELVEDARWAPSPHNIQPWLVRSRGSAAALYCPPDRLLPDTDPDMLFTGVGIGCFVESLAIAAAARKLALTVCLTGALPGDAGPFAELTLEHGTDEHLDVALLRLRRTSRLPYDGKPVDLGLHEDLADIAAGFGHSWTASDDRALVDWVVALNRETLFLDLADPVARNEVGRWLRFSAFEAARRRDGFSPRQLGFPGWLLRLFFTRHRLLELPGIGQLSHALYGRTLRGTRTIGWLRGPFATTEDGFMAGRMLLRLWLTMTAAGVQMHPFGSIITNATANARLQARIEAGEGTLWLVARLGHSVDPPRSHRLETSELVAA
jgi:hypothetical protein